MAKTRSGVIAALDLGTTKIACFIARVDPNGKIEIIGIGHQLSRGFRAGVVTDIKLAEQAILAAIEAAERMAATSIDSVIVNISGQKMASQHVSSQLPLQGNEITEKDIQKVLCLAINQSRHPEQELIHAIPLEYAIDGVVGIRDPKGMFGKQLTTYVHLITAPVATIMNLVNCLAKCQLDIEELVVSPFAAGLASLTEDEKELGVTLLDMGGGHTSFAVFKQGFLIYADSIPIGGHHITSDIAQGLSTTLSVAERLKTLHGNTVPTAVDEHELIEVPLLGEQEASREEMHHIPRAMLGNIIRPRVEEILEMIADKLHHSGVDHLSSKRLVLTGGGSQLMGMKELTSHYFSKQVRIGVPRTVEGLAESTKGPAFSTIVGMLQFAANKAQEVRYHIENYEEKRHGYVGKILKWLQENF